MDQPGVITGFIIIGTQTGTHRNNLYDPAYRTITGQEAPVSVAHVRMLNHTLDKYQHVKPYHPARDKVTAWGKSTGYGKD